MNNPAPTASITLEALVKEHNVLVDLAAENVALRNAVERQIQYINRLETFIQERIPEDSASQESSEGSPPEGEATEAP